MPYLYRMGRKVIGLGPVCMGGNSEERGDHMHGHSSWGVSGLSHRLGIPVLGCYAKETSSLGHLENCWNRQKGWRSLDSTHEEWVGASLPPGRVERGLP